MLKYIIPFLYTHRYNRKGIESIAYVLEYYVALALFVMLSCNNIDSVFIYLVSLTAFMLVYEIGYIENNVVAIEKESSPTIRHQRDELVYIKDNLKMIYMSRYLLSFGLVVGLSFYIDVTYLVASLVVTRGVYYLYNIKYRTGTFNRTLFVTLRLLRYFAPISFLGLVSLIAVLPIVVVNIINNYAWYDRSKVHFPRFFGTKLFDAIAYGMFFLLFKFLNYDSIAYLFLYLTVIKLVLFVAVLIKR